MINRCIEGDSSFGSCSSAAAARRWGPIASPHEVGCSAKIIEVQRLPFERMNIVAVGHQRLSHPRHPAQQPLPGRRCAILHPQDDDPRIMRACSKLLRPLIIKYLDILAAAEEIQFDPDQIPRTPKSLAQVASILLQTGQCPKAGNPGLRKHVGLAAPAAGDLSPGIRLAWHPPGAAGRGFQYRPFFQQLTALSGRARTGKIAPIARHDAAAMTGVRICPGA